MNKNNINLEIGTVYKKANSGTYYFRYQIKGARKAISLKTKNKKEAILKAEEMIPILKSDSKAIIAAHVEHAKGFSKKKKVLEISRIWEVYQKEPERAMPATKHEFQQYKASLVEFISQLKTNTPFINEITHLDADIFSTYLKEKEQAVDTHNKKIRRLAKIFEVLQDYTDGENPFSAKSLRRKPREEQNNTVRRLAFSKDHEKQLLEVLENDKFIVKNKSEIRVVYHLGMFTGQRFKDCVLLQLSKVDLNKRRIWVE